jgi:hypothetical protein
VQSAVVHTDRADSSAAGRALGEGIAAALPGDPPDAVVDYASPRHRPEELLAELRSRCRPGVLVGASSAGEFTRAVRGEDMACALALRGPEMEFAAALGRGLRRDPAGAAGAIVAGFRGRSGGQFPHRCALVMTDALAGHAQQLVEELTLATAGRYQFCGGGAGDNARFRDTRVFFGTQALGDAAVALEILSAHPVGIGVAHGWTPGGRGLRVTEAHGMRLVGLDGLPAIEAFEEHAERTGQRLDPADPMPFFLHNVLGIDTGAGHRLRIPLSVDAAGAVLCAAEIPEGAVVRIMRSSERSAVTAAERAAAAAIAALGGRRPQAALFFDCVATRLRLGAAFGRELGVVAEQLGDVDLAGCNTHGQIARAAGQFGGFHNCTAVVCVLPQ